RIFNACDKQPLADRLHAEKRRFTGQGPSVAAARTDPYSAPPRDPDRRISTLAACYEVFAKPPKTGWAAVLWPRSWRFWREASPFGASTISFAALAAPRWPRSVMPKFRSRASS